MEDTRMVREALFTYPACGKQGTDLTGIHTNEPCWEDALSPNNREGEILVMHYSVLSFP